MLNKCANGFFENLLATKFHADRTQFLSVDLMARAGLAEAVVKREVAGLCSAITEAEEGGRVERNGKPRGGAGARAC